MSSSGPIPRLFGPYVLTRHLGDRPPRQRLPRRDGLRAAPGPVPPRSASSRAPGSTRPPSCRRWRRRRSTSRWSAGPAVAKGAVLGIVDDVPFAGIEYVPGRTLDRLFSGEGQGSIPLPVEHALLIAEKLLVALEAGKPFEKKMGAPHGFLTPGFVTISNDGDVRVYGAGLGSGLLPSLKRPAVLAASGPYIAPEVLASGKPSAAGDIYSAAAILFQALTGRTPAAGAGTDALAGAVLAVDGSPVPEDLGKVLARGLTKDPDQREKDVVAYRKTLGKLLYGGPYAPSTFNLAFFMHQRFEKSIDKERKEMAQEETIDPKPLAAAEERKDKEARDRAQASRAAAAVAVPSFGAGTSPGTTTLGGTPVPKKPGLGGIPVPLVAGGVVVVLAVAGWLLLGRGASSRPRLPLRLRSRRRHADAGAGADSDDRRQGGPRLPGRSPGQAPGGDEEGRGARSRRSRPRPRRSAPTIRRSSRRRRGRTREAEEAVRSARDRADKEEAERLAKEAAEARAREDAVRKAAEAAVPKVKVGDLVDIGQVSRPPQATKVVKPEATTLARARKVSGTVLVRVLVDENGTRRAGRGLPRHDPEGRARRGEHLGREAVGVDARDEGRREGEDLDRRPAARSS